MTKRRIFVGDVQGCRVELVVGFLGAPGIVRVRGVVVQIGVDVAVTRMPKADEPLAVAGGDFFKPAHSLEDGTARHGHVAADTVWPKHV